MKKVFILFATSILSIGAFAQQVPNGGFENWNGTTNPINWNTLANGFIGIPGVEVFAQKDTAPQEHIEGSVSLKMRTDTIPGQPGNLRSYVGLGTIDVSQGIPSFSGVPYTIRPDTLSFAYFYVPGAGSDTAQIVVDFFQAGVSMLGGAKTFYLPASQGTFASIPLTSLFTVSGLPDTLSIFFKSGKSPGAEYGSTLILDDVKVSSVIATGIADLSASAVSAYPNPANSTINIAVAQSEIGSNVQLIDLTGREVYNVKLTSTTTAIDTKNLSTGVYAIRVASNDHLTIYKGKISVAH